MNKTKQENTETSNDELHIDLAAFEGPLDLLLHLIKQMEVDIFDIPIVDITNQYLETIHRHQKRDLELASDYLIMAASLIEIKTKLLLPKKAMKKEEEDDPRADLVQQLLTYKQYKAVSAILEEKQADRSLSYSKEASDLSDLQAVVPLPENEVSSEDLLSAFKKMFLRLKQEQPLERTVKGETFTIDEAITSIEEALDQESDHLSFFSLLSSNQPNREKVVTYFLALLQLVKQGKLLIQQDQIAADISIQKKDDGD
ncbi:MULTISPECIES: segregation and condensation protein A [Aerococcus]|uniref:Segregation and condensation protein A n=2 Tax=Aerococcus TaxID=1375 RepID=A0A5N1BI70_9LACT|nr:MULTISPECIES: segregation/condensation protein A [Aerococcus]KAA9239266.1 segregation and condensation protein A [Aerococcus urinae]KAA9293765.1 segregation and condensation protein A [Aerococcus mictus]MCY3035090.1 segregation/condensation protein A [Aerococcus mictus]MCY3063302.1 segregation/condensation protein A [Aerococcus mictus]MCY3065838.1 segregation/condensation protein A [Aerococcus mictus]